VFKAKKKKFRSEHHMLLASTEEENFWRLGNSQLNQESVTITETPMRQKI
jgi:hypothetical protein